MQFLFLAFSYTLTLDPVTHTKPSSVVQSQYHFAQTYNFNWAVNQTGIDYIM